MPNQALTTADFRNRLIGAVGRKGTKLRISVPGFAGLGLGVDVRNSKLLCITLFVQPSCRANAVRTMGSVMRLRVGRKVVSLPLRVQSVGKLRLEKRKR
jgi:hypothetical protein